MDVQLESHKPCLSSECGSSDALTYYRKEDGQEYAFCYSCNEYFPTSYCNEEIKENKVNKMKTTVQDILNNSQIAAIPDRGLSKETCEYFGIRVQFSEETGEIEKHFYPYYKDGKLVAFKCRIVSPKDFYIVGNINQGGFFNQEQCGNGGAFLIITEGELDAASIYQMLKKRGKNYRVVSLPNGANSKVIKDQFEWVSSFNTICLSFDNDKVGQDNIKKVAGFLKPGSVRILLLSEKDANKMLTENKEMELFNSLFNTREFRPDGIVGVDDLYDEAIKPIEHGFSWPWETLTKATYGYRWGEIYGIGGASGGGKTEFCKELVNHIISEHKRPVGVVFLEEPASKTLKVLAGKRFNKRFHVPDGDWTIDELVDGINNLKGKVFLYNHFGSKDWENIKSKIRYMVLGLGIKEIVLDHLTALVAQEDNEYKALNRIMEEMASLVEELNFSLFYVSHLRKKSGGTPHEEGGRVLADEFKGSGAIVYWSHFLFGIERDQQSEDPDVRNTTIFRILKDRITGLATGITFHLWYDHKTGLWREKTEEDYYEIL